MSERLYRWLLRLYPNHFRKTYGEAALQLFRDRARDERGVVAGARLWLDLLADLAASLPNEYHRDRRMVVEGIPAFQILNDESPRRGALLAGGLFSLALLTTFPMFIIHARSHAAWREQILPSLTEAACGVADIEVLPQNVGYLKLLAVPAPFRCSDAIMRPLDRSAAIILDLRESEPASAVLWFADRLSSKPLYVVTSPRGATLANELKKRHRATLVNDLETAQELAVARIRR